MPTDAEYEFLQSESESSDDQDGDEIEDDQGDDRDDDQDEIEVEPVESVDQDGDQDEIEDDQDGDEVLVPPVDPRTLLLVVSVGAVGWVLYRRLQSSPEDGDSPSPEPDQQTEPTEMDGGLVQ